MRLLLCTLISAFALLGLSADALASKKIDAEAQLVRPDGGPDADATGRIKLRLDPGKGWQQFEVRVEKVGTDLTFEVFLQDGPDSETYSHVGTLGDDHDGDDGDDGDGDNDDNDDNDDDDDDDDDDNDLDSQDGELKLKLDTKKGASLPLDAENLADLEGLRLEVRQDGAVVLFGDVPALDADGSSIKGSSKSEANTLLVRPDGAPDADATGRLRLRRDTKHATQEFKIEAEHLDGEAEYEAFLQDAADAETFTSLGTLHGDHPGKFELEIDTHDGDASPLGVSDLAELAGLRLELRRGGDVVLVGDVPAFGASKKSSKVKAGYGPGPDANPKTKAKLDLRSKPSKGDERMTLMVKQLSFADGAGYALFVETAGNSAEFEDAGALDQLGSSSNARYRRSTKKGQALPLGVASLADLGGRKFELRDGDGGVHVEGLIPHLD